MDTNTPPTDRPRLLFPSQAALRCLTKSKRLMDWVKAGIVPHVRMPDNTILFDALTLDEWIASRRVGPTAPEPEGVADAVAS